MSLIIPRNLNRAKAQDAQDAQGDEVIAQKNGYKLVHNTLNDGYWFYTKSGAGWGIVATNKVAAVNEFNRLVDSAQDAVARNAASDELNVGDKIWITQYGRNYPYTITKKWKEGWTFLYKAKNDKSGKEEIVAEAFANALDAAAKDKTPDGWWEGKTIFAAFGWGKSVKGKVVSHKNGVIKLADGTTFKESDAYDLYAINSHAGDSISDKEREYTRLYELAQKNITFYAAKGDSAKVAEWKRKADEYKRLAQEATDAAKATDAKDSAAADAKFKKGDRVKHAKVKFPVQPIGKISEVHEDPRWVEVEWENTPYKYQTIETSNLLPANSRATDACGTDAKLQKGDKVRVWQYPVYGKMGEVVEATYGGMEYTVNVEGKDYPRIDYRRIAKISDAASDAAELRVVHAKGIGKWWVEPNLSRFNDADREQTHKGRKEFPDREAAMKYARGTGKTFIVNDACDARDAAPFKVGDLVRMSEGGLTGKITKIEPTGHFRVSFLYNKANGFSQSFSANEIVMVKPAADAAEFHVGHRVRAKYPSWPGYQGHALGNGVYTVKKVDWDGTVMLNGFLDVWISPSALVEANDACGNRSK